MNINFNILFIAFLFICLFFFIARLFGFFKLRSLSIYPKLLRFCSFMLHIVRHNKKYANSFMQIANFLDGYSEIALITFLVVLNTSLKAFICLLFYANYKLGFYFLDFMSIFFIMLIFVLYVFVLELQNFCYHQSIMASDEFDFFEFVEETAESIVYKKLDVRLFDYTQFDKTKNFYQIKKEKKDLYQNSEDYNALVYRLLFPPLWYQKFTKILDVFFKANLFFNIFFLSLIILIFINS